MYYKPKPIVSQLSTKIAAAATMDSVKKYVDGKRLTLTATITTAWEGGAAPYIQTVAVPGLLATDMPHVAPVYSSSFATALEQKAAWAMIGYANTEEGKITFVCFEEKPATAVPIQIEVLR